MPEALTVDNPSGATWEGGFRKMLPPRSETFFPENKVFWSWYCGCAIPIYVSHHVFRNFTYRISSVLRRAAPINRRYSRINTGWDKV